MHRKAFKPGRLPDAIDSVQPDSEDKVEQIMNCRNQPVCPLFRVKMHKWFILPCSDKFHRKNPGFGFEHEIPGTMMPGRYLAERAPVIIACQNVSSLTQQFTAFRIREKAVAVFIIP